MGGVNNGAMGKRQLISRRASRIRTDIAFATVDVLVVVAAYSMGLGLRMLDPMVGDAQGYWTDLLIALPAIVLIHLVANAVAGAYGHVWEYASITEAVRLVMANAAASLAILGLSSVLRPGIVIPYLTLVVAGLLSLLLMGMVRFRSRLFSYRKNGGGQRVLVVGSGAEAAVFARRAPELEEGGTVVGFLRDRDTNHSSRRLIADLPILGGVDDIGRVVREEEIDQVVVVASSPEVARRVVDLCLDVDVRLRMLPGIADVMTNGRPSVDVRDIEVEDLLVREPVATDMRDVATLLEGKRVLVTGAGGSIGSELVRQVLRYQPEAVWALDRDETLLHEARLSWSGVVVPMLRDIRDAVGILRTFEAVKPEVVFHAAALKHVPVLEDFPDEAALTNVVGTRNVIEAGSRVGVERFVLISTDKAVEPTSVMGASKRVAELLVKAGTERNDGCIYTGVRFGNVLGSRGSVIPTFVSQIRAGGPVTVTDSAMTRYFMTVDEAVQLVLQAASLAKGSEIFLLDMGDPVKIEDLARRLIRLAGLLPGVDISIEYTGVRPGEKLEERLTSGPVASTNNPQIHEVPVSHPGAGTLAEAVDRLERSALSGQVEDVVEVLSLLTEGRLGQASGSTIRNPVASWS